MVVHCSKSYYGTARQAVPRGGRGAPGARGAPREVRGGARGEPINAPVCTNREDANQGEPLLSNTTCLTQVLFKGGEPWGKL